MFKRAMFFTTVSFVLLTGCTIRVVDFTAISTKNVRIPTVEKGSRVVGEDCIPVILFPLGIPNMKEAIDRAIEKAGPEYDALVDGVVYQLNHSFVFGQLCYRVEGTPINTKKSISLNETERKNLLGHSKRFDNNSPVLTNRQTWLHGSPPTRHSS